MRAGFQDAGFGDGGFEFTTEAEPPNGFDPLARVGETGVSADGADNHGAGRFDCTGLLDQMLESHVDIGAAPDVEAGGVSVAVNGHGIVQLEEATDPIGVVPMEEKLFDGFAFGVLTDEALAAVTIERDGGFAR